MAEIINYEELDNESYQVSVEEKDTRLDKFLASKNDKLSRNYIQQLIKESYVFVNQNIINKPSYNLDENDEVIIFYKPVEELKILPVNIPIEIIYEDKDIAVINKQAGLTTHPSPGHYDDTLVNAIMYHIKDLSTINGVIRPGIVHRLDKDTSGLIVIAKNDLAHEKLAEQLKEHTMQRTYIALVKGVMPSNSGTIKTLIGRDKNSRLKQAVVLENGKEAITDFKVLETYNDRYSLVELKLHTGRTHQIRVHMDFLKHPVINDPLYGENNKLQPISYQLLHAYKLKLIHPTTNEEMEFTCELPSRFSEVINNIR